jgi:dienelactone hydrolase
LIQEDPAGVKWIVNRGRRAGAVVQSFRYQGAGHLFTDPSLPDHDGPGAALAWQRSLSFLGGL